MDARNSRGRSRKNAAGAEVIFTEAPSRRFAPVGSNLRFPDSPGVDENFSFQNFGFAA
jgi:hypothetical protein